MCFKAGQRRFDKNQLFQVTVMLIVWFAVADGLRGQDSFDAVQSKYYQPFSQPETRYSRDTVLDTRFHIAFSQARIRVSKEFSDGIVATVTKDVNNDPDFKDKPEEVKQAEINRRVAALGLDPVNQSMNYFTRLYENMFPGPTLRVLPGDTLRVKLVNALHDPRIKRDIEKWKKMPDKDEHGNENKEKTKLLAKIQADLVANRTNFHTHGFHISPQSCLDMPNGKIVRASDDVLLTVLPPGDDPAPIGTEPKPWGQLLAGTTIISQQLQTQFDVPRNHVPGTHWYHPHLHGAVDTQVQNGMAGALIIDEPPSLQIRLKDGRQIPEKVIVLQEINNIVVRGPSGSGEAVLLETFNNPAALPFFLQPRKFAVPQNLPGGNLTVVNKQVPLITTINGLFQPTLHMTPGEVQRWRVLNAGSNTSAFNSLSVSGPKGSQPIEFYLIARDGVTLTGKLASHRVKDPVFMAPGNRIDLLVKAPSRDDGIHLAKTYDVLVNEKGFNPGVPGLQKPDGSGFTKEEIDSGVGKFSIFDDDFKKKYATGESPTIEDEPREVVLRGKPTDEIRYFRVPRIQQKTIVGHIEVKGLPANDELPDELPNHLTAPYVQPITDKEVAIPDAKRTIVFDVDASRKFLINKTQFDANKDQVVIKPNAVEEWTVINNGDQSHPFHIHVNPFQVMEVKQVIKMVDKKPVIETPSWAPPKGSWQDVINLPPRGWVKIRSRFYDFTGAYVLHCHILRHEDQSMMLIVTVGDREYPVCEPGGR